MADLDSALQHLLRASRISGNKNSYKKDNPSEYAAVKAYIDGGTRPSNVSTEMGQGLREVEDVNRGTVPVPPEPPDPPPVTGHVTGVHWAEAPEYSQLGSLGYQFVISNVAPGDINSARGKLDAAKAAGMKMVIGLYGFGGPEPYIRSGENWTLTPAAVESINFLESRSADIIAFFGFNEPYWEMKLSAQACRNFRTKIREVWPGARIHHDIGHPSQWAPGGPYSSGTPDPNAWADQSGVCDSVGVYGYPFVRGVYRRDENIGILHREVPFAVNQMGAVPMWLGQAHSTTDNVASWPTEPEMRDWNCTIRAELPANALISWYVWRQEIYVKYLANSLSYVPLTLASACS